MDPRPERLTFAKNLTISNWLERDETLDSFARLGPEGVVLPLTADDLARRILAVSLSPLVPGPIQELFQTAQGVLLYGNFFYPLFALGQEQLTRVAEAAIGEKFKDAGGPAAIVFMKPRLDWLHARGFLSEQEFAWWSSARNLRNYASHLELQMLVPPGETIGFLVRTAHAINCLFVPSLDFMSLWKN